MKVTMAELNKRANSILNQVNATGEIAIIFKHGRAIAEIRPIVEKTETNSAIEFLSNMTPVTVNESIDDVISRGRKYGL